MHVSTKLVIQKLQLRQHLFHDLTVEQVDDAVGVASVALRVGHHDDGGAFLVEVGEQVHHLATVLRVEVTCRFVGEDELGVGDDGAGDGHPLLLTARQLLREVVFAMSDVHAGHDGLHTLLALGSRDVHVAQRQFDVLIHIQLINEVETLKHEANVALAELGAVLFLEVADLMAEEFVTALGGVVQEAEDVEQGGLAASRRPHDGDKLAVVDFERNAVQCKGFNLFRSEKQVGDFNRWTEGQILYDKRNTLRLYENKVIKQFATPPLWKGIIYGLFTKSKAHRSYEYAKILGGLTPSPIAYREVRICGVLRESYYVCLKSECAYTFNDLIKNKTFPNRDIILKQIGKFTARLHQQGIVHRDYSGGNILFNGDGSIIHVIDLNRIRLCSPDRKERLQNFERLNIDRAALETMVTAYAEAMNEDALYDCRYVIEHRWRKHVKQGITNL